LRLTRGHLAELAIEYRTRAGFIPYARNARIHAPIAAIIRLIGAVLLEQNDEWQLQHRYMQVEVMAGLTAPENAADPRQIPCAA
jgi:hypothetical protein